MAHNLRVRRTQKLLREALVALLEESDFERITVGTLTERALVSRASFYRYYHDKYALVEQIVTDALSGVVAAIGEVRTVHPARVWVRFFEHLAHEERLYRALLGRNGSPWFAQYLRSTLADLIAVPEPPSSVPPTVRAAHQGAEAWMLGGVATLWVETITWWLEQGRPYSPREMATRSALLATALFTEVSTWHAGRSD